MKEDAVYVLPEQAELFNQLVEHETRMIDDDSNFIRMYSTYQGKNYLVIASRYHEIFIVTSIQILD